MQWLSHLTVVKHNQEHQSATNLQVSFAILCTLVSPCTLQSWCSSWFWEETIASTKPEDLSMKISLVAKPDGVTIWAILTERSVNTTFCEVSLEVNPAVMPQPVTILQQHEVTENAVTWLAKYSKASTITKQHINAVFIKIFAQEVKFFSPKDHSPLQSLQTHVQLLERADTLVNSTVT